MAFATPRSATPRSEQYTVQRQCALDLQLPDLLQAEGRGFICRGEMKDERRTEERERETRETAVDSSTGNCVGAVVCDDDTKITATAAISNNNDKNKGILRFLK
uniref:Uncharacterized protein n=1 Tax=Nelumbo nucifera TaxID=4432 RepID=A0A822Z2N3_NELNU|nr:TPA_asm: hypothetical protein HUJ06_008602 [Nelumbo nucifera]